MTTAEENLVIPDYSDQSKFQVLDGPLQQLPHKCAACYRYDNPEPEREGHLKFITWNQDIEFFGVVFICTDCLREIMNQLGWADAAQVLRAKNQITDLLDQVRYLSEENENLRNAVGNLSTIAVGGVVPGRDLVVGLEDRNETPVVEPGVTDEAVSEPEELGGPSPEPDGPVDEQGPTDVRDDDDLLKLLDEI